MTATLTDLRKLARPLSAFAAFHSHFARCLPSTVLLKCSKSDSEGPPAKHHMPITGSQIAHPSEEPGTNGTIGFPVEAVHYIPPGVKQPTDADEVIGMKSSICKVCDDCRKRELPFPESAVEICCACTGDHDCVDILSVWHRVNVGSDFG
jgi:hypothetical protein